MWACRGAELGNRVAALTVVAYGFYSLGEKDVGKVCTFSALAGLYH